MNNVPPNLSAQLMVDIETLSTTPDAAVLSIGIVAFSQDKGVIASEGWAIRPQDWHGDIDPKTVVWWNQQNEAARDYSFNGRVQALNAANCFRNFILKWGSMDDQCEVWANDPDFDIVILKQWWKRVEAETKTTLGPFPIHYRAPRSCRTMKAEAKRLGIHYDGANASTVFHNPVDDAALQAREIIQIRNNIIGAAA